MDLTEVVVVVIQIIGSAVIVPLVAFIIKWLSSKIKSEELLTALTEFGEVAEQVVAGLEATLVYELRQKSEDGTLSKEDVSEIVKTGTVQFLADLSVKSRAVLMDNAADIEGYIRRRIELALNITKATK